MNLGTSSTARWTIAIGLLGIFASICAAGLTYYASYLSTRQVAIETCMQRVDKQEAIIREKSEAVLGAIAAFGSKIQAPDSTGVDKEALFHSLGQVVLETSMRLVAYAPAELVVPTLHLAATVQIGLMAETTEEKLASLSLAPTAMKDWPKQYFALMDKFESRRKDCFQ
ncbi:hypothetical protein BK635_13160 [Pseudomonas chlororaphis]|uniref:hypothetical protein n=1 Tax=Pseudomonas chlororaphis TaxID=587753 RepID=UPI000F46616B|nr:hypothetical protein [Pseudomonas chlororaphis]RON82443.1 hypothetical protein BK635_13160 [Pseudomonas chlororaphis]